MRSYDMFPDAAIDYMLKHQKVEDMNRLEEDGDLITREEWLKLVRFNAYTPDDGDAYLSDGTYVDLTNSAFDGLTDDTTHVYLVPK